MNRRTPPARRARGLARLLLVLVLVGAALTPGSFGFSSRPERPRPFASSGTREPVLLRVVALGDSVTAGNGCDCTPFPALYARELSRSRGVEASAVNLGAGGLDSDGLFAMLTEGTDAARTVADSNVVVITIGANDFGSQHDDVVSGACTGSCLTDTVRHMSSEVTRILDRVRELRSGRSTAVLITGYWNVFEGGAVARRLFPDVGLAATAALTDRVNDALHGVAERGHATYVDLYGPFKGLDTDGEDTDLLADDGDHPDARGHLLIAETLEKAGLPGLGARAG